MATYSVVIPTYNHEATLGRAAGSILGQEGVDPAAVEVVVADDGSADGTLAQARSLAAADPRIRIVGHGKNTGTLRNRRDGVLATDSPWVMLMDADDELGPGVLSTLAAAVEDGPAQIVHFGVEVVAETPAAAAAAAGMEGFLTPRPRRLEGAAILASQLAGEGGFDWHLHHRLFDGDLIRSAYAAAADERLTVADDIYLSFIVASRAESYRALAGGPRYRYHLGAGDTFGSALDIAHLARLAEADACALRLAKAYVSGGAPPETTGACASPTSGTASPSTSQTSGGTTSPRPSASPASTRSSPSGAPRRASQPSPRSCGGSSATVPMASGCPTTATTPASVPPSATCSGRPRPWRRRPASRPAASPAATRCGPRPWGTWTTSRSPPPGGERRRALGRRWETSPGSWPVSRARPPGL